MGKKKKGLIVSFKYYAYFKGKESKVEFTTYFEVLFIA